MRRLVPGARRAAEGVSVALFFAMFALFLLGIAARYLAALPLAWTDELIMVLFIWLVFLTEAAVIEEREQISFDVIYDQAEARGRRVIGILAALLLGGAFLASLPTVVDYVAFLRRERTAVLQWRLDLVYACFVVFWVAVVLRSLARLARLAGPRWREAVGRVAVDERAGILG